MKNERTAASFLRNSIAVRLCFELATPADVAIPATAAAAKRTSATSGGSAIDTPATARRSSAQGTSIPSACLRPKSGRLSHRLPIEQAIAKRTKLTPPATNPTTRRSSGIMKIAEPEKYEEEERAHAPCDAARFLARQECVGLARHVALDESDGIEAARFVVLPDRGRSRRVALEEEPVDERALVPGKLLARDLQVHPELGFVRLADGLGLDLLLRDETGEERGDLGLFDLAVPGRAHGLRADRKKVLFDPSPVDPRQRVEAAEAVLARGERDPREEGAGGDQPEDGDAARRAVGTRRRGAHADVLERNPDEGFLSWSDVRDLAVDLRLVRAPGLVDVEIERESLDGARAVGEKKLVIEQIAFAAADENVREGVVEDVGDPLAFERRIFRKTAPPAQRLRIGEVILVDALEAAPLERHLRAGRGIDARNGMQLELLPGLEAEGPLAPVPVAVEDVALALLDAEAPVGFEAGIDLDRGPAEAPLGAEIRRDEKRRGEGRGGDDFSHRGIVAGTR